MKKVKILYVEDNPGNRLLIRRVLEAEGYAVLEAEDSIATLEVLEREIPDLILMDINLPKVDGYTLTNQLRQREKLRQVPIIALTAHALKGDRDRAIEAGCDGYIQKPIDVDLLPSQVASFLAKKDTHAS